MVDRRQAPPQNQLYFPQRTADFVADAAARATLDVLTKWVPKSNRSGCDRDDSQLEGRSVA